MELAFFLKFQADGFLRNSCTETFVDSGQLFNFEFISSFSANISRLTAVNFRKIPGAYV